MIKRMLSMTLRSTLALLLFGSALGSAVAREPGAPAGKGEAGYDQKITVCPLLVSSTAGNGAAVVYPQTEHPEVRFLMVEVPPGMETGWHRHPMPCYGYIVAGSITVDLEDGKSLVYKEGEALVEVVNTLHNGRNTGTTPTRILMVVTSAKDVPTAVAEKKAPPKP